MDLKVRRSGKPGRARASSRRPKSAGEGGRAQLLGLLLSLLIALLAAGPASAGAAPARYIYEMCDSALPGGGVAGVVYAPDPSEPYGSEDTCAQPGGSLSVHQNGFVSPGGESEWGVPIEAPPGATLESITITGAVCGGWPSTGYIFSEGWPGVTCGEDVRSFKVGGDFEGFLIDLDCHNECQPGPWVEAHYFATIVVDASAPTLSELGGSLLDGNVQRGHQSIGIKAHDIGGGISDISVLVNGLPAGAPKLANCNVAQAKNPSVTGTVAAQISPCPAELSASWSLDTGAYPFRTGTNSFQICASDFATLGDPNTTCSPTQMISVDDSCSESAVAGGDVLSAQFAQSNADTVTVGFGQSAAITGQLSTNAGDPVPGATLCVKMATLGIDSQAAPVGVVKTDANGRYSYDVPPGPNREVVIGYRHDASQVARQVRYYAHVQPSLQSVPDKTSQRQAGPLLGAASGTVRRRPRSRPAGERCGLEALDHLPPGQRRSKWRLSGQLPLQRDHQDDQIQVSGDSSDSGWVSLARRHKRTGDGAGQALRAPLVRRGLRYQCRVSAQ